MITIVESGGANIASILFALERINVKSEWTADPDKIAKASRVMLPGVGAAAEAMEQIRARELEECLKSLTCPAFGICLGMQLLFKSSEEGNATMLGLINAPVVKFCEEKDKTIPHMGWNALDITRTGTPLLDGVEDESFFYFVHSYYVPLGNYTVGETTHGTERFSAVVARDNFMGCQFHPERSGPAGSRILENFSKL